MDPGFYVDVVFTQTALLKHYYRQITPPIWQWHSLTAAASLMRHTDALGS